MPALMSWAISRMSHTAPTEVLPERCPATAKICSASESRILCWASCGVNSSDRVSAISVLVRRQLPRDDRRPGSHHVRHQSLEVLSKGGVVVVLVLGQLLKGIGQHH